MNTKVLLVCVVLCVLVCIIDASSVRIAGNTIPTETKTVKEDNGILNGETNGDVGAMSDDVAGNKVPTETKKSPDRVESQVSKVKRDIGIGETNEDIDVKTLMERLLAFENKFDELKQTIAEDSSRINKLETNSYQIEQLLEYDSVDNAIECYTQPNGVDYRGTVSTTIGNRVCQKWSDQQPHSHSFTDDMYKYAGLGSHNYCRNPDGASGPWCFTTDPAIRAEYCDVGTAQETCEQGITIQGGSVYIRYGRTTCPDTADYVYDGFVAGTYYSSEGGGTQFLCMPPDPIYDDVLSTVDGARASVYHTQYRSMTSTLAEYNNHDPPCVVCRVPNRSTVLMVPARNDCPDDTWTEEYHGYLFASKNVENRHESEFICVDSNLESLDNSAADIYGSHIFQVESRCVVGGSMPCGPYEDGHELTCAVCTK